MKFSSICYRQSFDKLAELIAAHSPLCVVSGAGISTESGIPDYRDTSGEWKRPPPMSHQKFMGSHAARQRYWARALIGFQALLDAKPGQGHKALAILERKGIINGIITQNVDRLHQRAGSTRVIDLHGRADQVVCMTCGFREQRDSWHHHLSHLNPHWAKPDSGPVAIAPDGDAYIEGDFSSFTVPPCPSCNEGIMKPDVVYFGSNVSRSVLDASMSMLRKSNGLWVVGSSLMVFSGYRFAREAHSLNLPILCLNQGHTRADHLYLHKCSSPIGESLSALVGNLEKSGLSNNKTATNPIEDSAF